MVVVIGAGSGIGRAVTLALLDVGHRVVLAGRRREPLEATREAAGAAADQAFVVPADVTEPSSVAALFAQARAVNGRVDVLFNNAGVLGPTAPVEDVSLEQWREVVDTNLTGAFLCAQAAFRTMRDQDPRGGRIINNGSVSAQAPRPQAVAYTATKHALTGLTKALALEGRPYGIACGQIDVGNAVTPMTRGVRRGALQADGTVVAEPSIDAGHVADAVRYMVELPVEANVLSLTVMATGMPLVGRG